MDNRSIHELLRDISDQTTALVRKEVELAKVELASKGRRAGAGTGVLVAGVLLLLYGLGAFTAGLIMVIGLGVVEWLAAFIVAAGMAILAAIFALVGVKLLQRAGPPLPEKTLESVKEDVEVARERARAGRN